MTRSTLTVSAFIAFAVLNLSTGCSSPQSPPLDAGAGGGGETGGGSGGATGGGSTGGQDGGDKVCAGEQCPSCCQGCCSGQGADMVCELGTAMSACGKGGAACLACSKFDEETCVESTCAAARKPRTGQACIVDSDCNGGGLTCRKTTQHGWAQYPGGYCTRECEAQDDDLQCSRDAVCAWTGEDLDETNLCLARCRVSVSGSCREGYSCYPIDTLGNGVCFLTEPAKSPDAGTIGAACERDYQCQPGRAFCIKESDMIGSSGYTGGYCSLECNVTNASACGDSAVCVKTYDDSSIPGSCFQVCDSPGQGQSNCRAGYNCLTRRDLDGGVSDGGYCRPRCDVLGSQCPATYVCEQDGGVERSGYCCIPSGGACRGTCANQDGFACGG